MQTPPELPPLPSTSMQAAPQAPPPNATASSSPAKAGFGLRRVRQMVTFMAAGGFSLIALLSVGEVVLRDDLRPTSIAATIEARTELGIFNQKLGHKPGELVLTEADYQRSLANAQREGQAKAEIEFQRDLADVQAQKERVVGAYQTLYQRANIIAQAALQMEGVAQQFRQQLLQSTNGGRVLIIGWHDIMCEAGFQESCEKAKLARSTMVSEADGLSRGDVGNRIRELMAGIDDPATFITRDDRKRRGEPVPPQ